MAHQRPTATSVAGASAALLVAGAATVLIVLPEASRTVAFTALGGCVAYLLSRAVWNQRRARTRRRGPAAEELRLDLDRTLVVATLDTAVVARESDLTPEQAAHLWGAILVDQDHRTFRLLIAPPPDGAVAAVQLLRSFYPVRVEVWQAPTTLTGQPASPRLRSLVDATLQPQAEDPAG